MQKINKAVILCAGYATRFLPETKVTPKELLPLYDTPVLQHIVDDLISVGVKEICFVIRKGKENILHHFLPNKKWEKNVKNSEKIKFEKYKQIKFFVRFQKKPLGTGNALLSAKDFCDQPFFLLNGDEVVKNPIPPTKQMLEFWRKNGGCVLGVKRVVKKEVTKYGMINYVTKNKLKIINQIEEKPDILSTPSLFANIGIYILNNEFIRHISTKNENEVPITDAINSFVKEHTMFALSIKGKRYDMGSPLSYVLNNIDYCLHRDDTHDQTLKFLKKLIKEK